MLPNISTKIEIYYPDSFAMVRLKGRSNFECPRKWSALRFTVLSDKYVLTLLKTAKPICMLRRYRASPALLWQNLPTFLFLITFLSLSSHTPLSFSSWFHVNLRWHQAPYFFQNFTDYFTISGKFVFAQFKEKGRKYVNPHLSVYNFIKLNL